MSSCWRKSAFRNGMSSVNAKASSTDASMLLAVAAVIRQA
jgi:hypothetical protein